MMNDMMKMNGDMKDMGMKMSLQQMDMNTVMYPEISGPETKSKKAEDHSQHNNEKTAATNSTNGHDEHAGHGTSSTDMVTLNYGMLRATHKTTLDPAAPVRQLRFELTGNMNRYVWSMDNRVLSEVDKILIKKDEVLRIVLYNNSMMRHPMHLHGFDFRVINGQGDYAPLKMCWILCLWKPTPLNLQPTHMAIGFSIATLCTT